MTRPIRILHINYKMHCAGIEAFIMNMYRNIDRSKIQFDFLVHYTEKQFYDDEIENMGGKIYRLSIREDNNFIKYLTDLNNFFSEHNGYKIVHAHMESFAMFYLPFVKKAGIPVIIAHSHNDKVDPSIKGFLKNIMNISFKYLATDYMASSDSSGQFLFGDKSYWVIQNAIDAKKFSFDDVVRSEVRLELGLQDKFVVGHIGRFNKQKNHDFLIDIFAELYKINKNALLLSVGNGILKDRIKEKVKLLGLEDAVVFLGVRSDIHRLYQAMDVFVFPSLYEGLGIVGIESQASGLKTICSDKIPPEANITNYFLSISLDKSPLEWAKIINQYSKPYRRRNTYSDIKRANFDISTSAKKLQNYYLKKYNEITFN